MYVQEGVILWGRVVSLGAVRRENASLPWQAIRCHFHQDDEVLGDGSGFETVEEAQRAVEAACAEV